MIHKIKPELTLYLAENALKDKFADSSVNMQEMIEFQRDCRDYMSVSNIRKIYARMMKIEVTRMMVDAVYNSLSAEEQEFIILKYKKKKQMVAISLTLNISLAQLNLRQHIILEKVSEFMLYRLSEEDIYKRNKISDMVELLGRIMAFAEQYDPKREFINNEWIEAIAERHDKYFLMMNEVEIMLSEDSLHARIVTEKMKNPLENIEIIAKRCNVDKSIISRHLKNFADSMKKYIE